MQHAAACLPRASADAAAMVLRVHVALMVPGTDRICIHSLCTGAELGAKAKCLKVVACSISINLT
jgi:hypothetical protein